MTYQKHYPMPELSEQEREHVSAECRRLIAESEVVGAGYRTVTKGAVAKIALAALNAQVLGYVNDRLDMASEGDHFAATLWKNKWPNACGLDYVRPVYDSPPVPALKPIEFHDCDKGAVSHMSGGSDEYCNGFVDGIQNAICILRSLGYEVKSET